jgi:trigger factor
MSVSVEKTSSFGRRLTIEVPAAVVKAEEKTILKKIAKTANIKGFRPGKVPESYIKDNYGEQCRSDAVEKAYQDSLTSTLKEQNLRLANQPNVEDLKYNEGENLTYTVSFEVFPDIELPDFSTVVLEKEVAEITDADIDSGIEKLQDQFASWAITDKPAKLGDLLTIDFVGLLDGEPFANGSSENFDLELGSKRFIPGFEEGLVGVTAGSDKTLDITFPAEYGAKDLAGKAVQFNVNVKKVQSKDRTPVDAEFAGRIGIEDKDVSKVRDKIRENMLKFVDDTVKTKLRDQALEKLYSVCTIDLPTSLIEQEKHNMLHEKHGKEADCKTAHGQELSKEEDEKMSADAKKRVTVGLLLNEIISKNKIQPEEARVMAKLRSMALMYGGQAEFIQKMYYESKELRQNVLNMVLTDQAADLVVSGATIKEKNSTFYGIVNAETE